MQKDFGISSGAEPATGGFQLHAQSAEVVDGTIENNANFAVIAQHRLAAGLAQVIDG